MLTIIVALLALIAVGDVALADAAAPPSAPPDLAALWPMIGLAIATAWGYAARWFTATKWAQAHNVLGHLGITLIGALISGCTPVFQSGHVTGAALAWAAMGVLPTFLAGLNHPTDGAKSAAAALLPLLILPALLASGCGSAMSDTLKVEDTLAVTSSLVAHGVDSADAFLESKTRATMATNPAAAKSAYDGYKPKIEKARGAVHTANDAISDAEAVRAKIPAASGGTCSSGCTGVASDFTSWLPALTQALAALQQAYADVKGMVH